VRKYEKEMSRGEKKFFRIGFRVKDNLCLELRIKRELEEKMSGRVFKILFGPYKEVRVYGNWSNQYPRICGIFLKSRVTVDR